MATQTEEIRTGTRMLTLSASQTDNYATFYQHARSLTIRADDDVWINFDAVATTAVPNIFLKNGEVLNINDVNYTTIHVIKVGSGTTTVRVTYQYIV